jgi:hypothetical protein
MLQVHVKSTIEFLSLFTEGCARRRIGATDISSCSHAVLSVMVTNEDETNQHEFLTGKLNLVDLAGMVYIILIYIHFTWIIYYLVSYVDLCLLGLHEVVLCAFIQTDSLSLQINMSTLHLENVNVWRCESGGIFGNVRLMLDTIHNLSKSICLQYISNRLRSAVALVKDTLEMLPQLSSIICR